MSMIRKKKKKINKIHNIIIYLVQCSLCKKLYSGRTVNTLRTRIGQHRTSFYALLNEKPVDLTDDEHSLGVHLYTEHGLRHHSDFNKHYKICIIDNASPKMLELK